MVGILAVFFLAALPSQASDITTKTRIALVVRDETSDGRYGDQISAWLESIVLSSGNFEVVPKSRACYVMLGVLKRAQEISIQNNPAVQVHFELSLRDANSPSIYPRINIMRSIARPVFKPADEAIQEVMREALAPLEAGLPNQC